MKTFTCDFKRDEDCRSIKENPTVQTYDPWGLGFDEDINTITAPTAPAAVHTRQITRARAHQLNYQVLSSW